MSSPASDDSVPEIRPHTEATVTAHRPYAVRDLSVDALPSRDGRIDVALLRLRDQDYSSPTRWPSPHQLRILGHGSKLIGDKERRGRPSGKRSMERLAAIKCEACRKGAPTVTDAEMQTYLTQVPGWEVVERDGIRRLERSFSFRDFSDALAFTNGVGRVAEDEGHHPAIVTEWGRVTVTWWTHKIRGLHLNDFVMAAKTDELYTT